jgi:hypothetical protein
VENLLSEMTLEEKITQMGNDSRTIERLEIPEYNWWNECLHGVAAAGIATVFPQAIGLGATWDADLVHRVAIATSDEARAKHHNALKNGKREIFYGLTFWSPNINIFRDPRWGRGQETYGEDPYLTARLGVQFVKGLQGDHPKYLKLVSTPKHYAVHSGPEPLRYRFNAIADERDLRMTYLPAFKACVQEARAQSVMCAYNRYRDEPCCAHKYLIEDILRSEWGFDGYVVSDCGAISNIHNDHFSIRWTGFLTPPKSGDYKIGVTNDDGMKLYQEDLLDLLYRTGKPVALVLLNGSPVAINRGDERFPAILEAWYPGEEGGTAIADVLFGDYNPAGRLPVTFYKSLDQVPDFENYNMEGRTYRYLKEEPLYPFGYGLSYTRFHYSSLKIEPGQPETGENIKVSVCVKNKGKVPGDEVVQLYIGDLKATAPVPIRQLAGFQRIRLKPDEKKVVTFHLNPRQFAFWDDSGKWLVEPGDFEISVGGCLPSHKFEKRSGSKVLTKQIKMNGKKIYFDD